MKNKYIKSKVASSPEANVINAVDVIEHILGKDGLIEQNKDILLKPILFNEITLEDDY